MKPKPGFEKFWASRDDGYQTSVNRWATSRAAAVIAYLGARLGLTPNQVTLLSFVCGALGFLIAFSLPVDRPAIAIAMIVILAELTFILDCADGLLARVTDRVSPHGEPIDHTMDIASQSCALSGVFVYAYRAGLSQREPELAHGFLIVGFLFLVARATRHIAIHLSQSSLKHQEPVQRAWGAAMNRLFTNFLEYQASLVADAAYLVSPVICLVVFAAQALLCATAVTRRMLWAMKFEQA